MLPKKTLSNEAVIFLVIEETISSNNMLGQVEINNMEAVNGSFSPQDYKLILGAIQMKQISFGHKSYISSMSSNSNLHATWF